jgi:hypothetical protein
MITPLHIPGLPLRPPPISSRPAHERLKQAWQHFFNGPPDLPSVEARIAAVTRAIDWMINACSANQSTRSMLAAGPSRPLPAAV